MDFVLFFFSGHFDNERLERMKVDIGVTALLHTKIDETVAKLHFPPESRIASFLISYIKRLTTLNAPEHPCKAT